MTAKRQPPPSKLFRISISVLVVAHLLAVFLPPMSFQAQGPLGQSPSIATLMAPLERYSEFLYINRGYAFFAPDPGPSHLVQAAITDSTGQREEILFPDLQQQWPRLLYHRHFMLAEYLNEIYQPPGPPDELVEVDPEAADFWIRSRARYEHVRQSIVEHLKHEYPGKDVAIRRIEHLIPDLIAYQQEPIELNDPRLYEVMLDQLPTVEAAGDLSAPAGPPETIPAPTGDPAQNEASSAEGDERDAVEAGTDSGSGEGG